MNVKIQRQNRKTLALKVTPAGVTALIPRQLDAAGAQVQAFIAEGLRRLEPPPPVPAAERLTRDDILALVSDQAGRLGVQVQRIQFQPMRRKWGSISTAGNLTLAADLTRLPRRLVAYVICHELLHLKVPAHNRLYHLLLRQAIPDWRERERELARWALDGQGSPG
jgi:hypothetical protein